MADFDGSNDLVTGATLAFGDADDPDGSNDLVTAAINLAPGDADSPDGYSTTYFGTDYQLDTTKPVISNVSPTPGFAVGLSTPLVFEVTDETGLRRALVKLSLAGNPDWFLPHDGDSFSPRFAAGSTRVAISSGYRFSLVRDGGWTVSPTITPIVLDVSGNENL